jgi:dinuclear metal center YbgI/SA1388 family protein
MIKIDDLEKYLFNKLNPKNAEILDMFTNGLQIHCTQDVNKIAFGVDASIEFMRKAIESGANTVIVHHGINFYKHNNCIPTEQFHNRLKFAFQNNLNVFGFHYLLDSHSELGNSAQVLILLGLKPLEPVYFDHGMYWGWGATSDKELDVNDIFTKLNEQFNSNAKMHQFGKKQINKIGVVTGSGSDSIDELFEKGYDLLITGDISESTQEKAREIGINVIWGGHYITEKLGVLALKNDLDLKIGKEVETVFIEVENLS